MVSARWDRDSIEFVDSWMRRSQIGYLKLACAVAHVWYLKFVPSYIVNFLDKPLKELGLVYCDVWSDQYSDCADLNWEIIFQFTPIGMPGPAMSHG